MNQFLRMCRFFGLPHFLLDFELSTVVIYHNILIFSHLILSTKDWTEFWEECKSWIKKKQQYLINWKKTQGNGWIMETSGFLRFSCVWVCAYAMFHKKTPQIEML